VVTFVTGYGVFVVLQQILLMPHDEIGGVEQRHGHRVQVDRVTLHTVTINYFGINKTNRFENDVSS